MKIHAKAPNRIDLSGGTLDIYPLYVFLNGGWTLNAAIDLYSEVTLEPLSDPIFKLYSQDMNKEASFKPEDLNPDQFAGHPFELILHILNFYQPKAGLKITTHNQAPKGSGLGASSSLLIALSGALNQWTQRYESGETLIEYGANIEAQSLGIPTGKQDYYAALYGGISAIHFQASGIQHQHLSPSQQFIDQLNQHLIVSFTGQSHFSGTNNWGMLKAFVENQGQTRSHLKAIQQTAQKMKLAIEQSDFEAFTALIKEEWLNRKVLAEGVSTPQIDAMMSSASQAGALAHKICGAGGGGCMLTLCPPEHQEEAKKALENEGSRILPQALTHTGLIVNQT